MGNTLTAGVGMSGGDTDAAVAVVDDDMTRLYMALQSPSSL